MGKRTKFDHDLGLRHKEGMTAEKFIKQYCEVFRPYAYATKDDKILDTHGGSFTHARAAHDMGFDLDIMDIDKDYYLAGLEAFKKHTDQMRMF